MHGYLVRRVGASSADELLGETFRIALERRSSCDLARENARPWWYGIATNLIARHQRRPTGMGDQRVLRTAKPEASA